MLRHRCQPARTRPARHGARTGVRAAAAVSSPARAAPRGDQAQEQHRRLLETPLPQLMAEAAALRDEGHGRVVTFSPKVFIPLTRLCRDACGYCTFAQGPQPGRRAYMTLDEVLAVARLGAQQGCSEALFTLGDKPELAWPQAAAELKAMGHASTLAYVEAAAAAVLAQTGLLPHINAGVMGAADLQRLKLVSASQGLMLEATAASLAGPGGPHDAAACPDKDPAARLAVIEAAGRARVPFTSGILIGIGETRAERLQALQALAELQAAHGHIQEVIIQNFRAKPNTAMAGHTEPPLEELLWTVAAARILLGPSMSIQAPPNLTPTPPAAGGGSGDDGSSGDVDASWGQLLAAGINDWGGISPVTRDYVNPEKAWPHLSPLAAATAAAGKLLLPRLPVYPRHLLDLGAGQQQQQRRLAGRRAGAGASSGGNGGGGGSGSCGEASPAGLQAPLEPWLSTAGGGLSVAAGCHRLSDSSGLLRANAWAAGRPDAEPGSEQAALPLQAALNEQLKAPLRAVQQGLAQGEQQQQQQPQQPSVPLPRPRAAKAWRVAVDDWGVLEGVPALQQVAPAIQRLLAEVLASAADVSAARTSSGRGHRISAPARSGRAWSQDEVELLLSTRGADMQAVVAAADQLRRLVCGDTVSYVVNRNINYTNVCSYACRFCAFSKGKAAEELRGPAYLIPLEEVTRRTAEAWARGATEVCLQGGIHPDFTGDTYLAILAAAKAGAPDIHVHAFSPLEVLHGASTLGLPVPAFLSRLQAAGLGSLPGTAAEVLDDAVRRLLCPDKLSTAHWLEVVGAAHSIGLPTTSTIMFGHLDSPRAWAAHLIALRSLQAQTGGITEFVPLPFVHFEAPIYLSGGARRGPTLRECVLLHAVGRLVLHPLVTNIQASWVKMGPERAAQLLAAGANDMGGSIMNESITRAAGASHGQELAPTRMESLIRAAGRTPVQRTTLYGTAPPGQVAASLAASGPLAPLVLQRP